MAKATGRRYCDVKPRTPRPLPPGLPINRERAIRLLRVTWANFTALHYAFIGGPEPQRQVVRNAFTEWKGLGIGLAFTEVPSPGEAEVRISFVDDGSWSYVGRDVLDIPITEATMNFGWDLTDDYGHSTALHEIGHTLGMPHEHQNPFAGIVWNEEAVYAAFGAPPNNWSREQTFHNVLRKIHPSEVAGSLWDPDSVMEYWFPKGLIKEPAKYSEGLTPPGGLSAEDKAWMVQFYPPAPKGKVPLLEEFQSVPLKLKPAEQADFRIKPEASREYTIGTFGTADTVMVLFEEVDGDLKYLYGDDDSGTERNSAITAKLLAGRKYVLRVRLYWVGRSGKTAVMYW